MEVHGKAGPVQVGMVVDSVSEVLNITAEEIEPPPALGISTDTDSILGMAKVKEEVKILLDADKVIGEGVLEQFSEM